MSQPQKSVTLLPCPGGKTTKSTRTCGGIERRLMTIRSVAKHNSVKKYGTWVLKNAFETSALDRMRGVMIPSIYLPRINLRYTFCKRFDGSLSQFGHPVPVSHFTGRTFKPLHFKCMWAPVTTGQHVHLKLEIQRAWKESSVVHLQGRRETFSVVRSDKQADSNIWVSEYETHKLTVVMCHVNGVDVITAKWTIV